MPRAARRLSRGLTGGEAAKHGGDVIDALGARSLQQPPPAAAISADGFTALHLAVDAEQADAARMLIERGADVNVRSRGPIARVPPLGSAAFVRSVPLARLLLDAGADVDGQRDGAFTALHSAAVNGDTALVELLLEGRADPNVTDAQGRRPADLARSPEVEALLAR